jgi:hypothetical protein
MNETILDFKFWIGKPAQLFLTDGWLLLSG